MEEKIRGKEVKRVRRQSIEMIIYMKIEILKIVTGLLLE